MKEEAPAGEVGKGGLVYPLCSQSAHDQKCREGTALLPFVLAHRAPKKVLAGRAQ